MADDRTIKSAVYGRYTVRRVTLKSGAIGYAVSFAYDASAVRHVRQIAGARWMAGDKAWFVPTAGDGDLAAILAIETKNPAIAPGSRYAHHHNDAVARADSTNRRLPGGELVITD